MAPPVDLPLPLERPELSPQVQIPGEEELWGPAGDVTIQSLAAMAEARRRCFKAKVCFAAYTFGTGVTYRATARRDQFSPLEGTSELAQQLHATLSMIPEADHDFIRFRREVARLVIPFVAPELSS